MSKLEFTAPPPVQEGEAFWLQDQNRGEAIPTDREPAEPATAPLEESVPMEYTPRNAEDAALVQLYGLPPARPTWSEPWNADDSQFSEEDRKLLDEGFRLFEHRAKFAAQWPKNSEGVEIRTPEQWLVLEKEKRREEEHNKQVLESLQPRKPGRPRAKNAPSPEEKAGKSQAYHSYIAACKSRKEAAEAVGAYMNQLRAERDAITKELRDLQEIKNYLKELVPAPPK